MTINMRFKTAYHTELIRNVIFMQNSFFTWIFKDFREKRSEVAAIGYICALMLCQIQIKTVAKHTVLLVFNS